MSALPPLPSFPPRADPAWNEAYERVESYLRAHRIEQPIALSELTNAIIAAAWQQAADAPVITPVTLALREADRLITEWFVRVLAKGGAHSRRLSVRGRLALALADAPGRWPDAFLAPVAPPRELADAMRAAFLRTGPPPQLSKMTAQTIPLGRVARLLDLSWEAALRWSAFRYLAQLLFVGAVATVLFYAFR